MISANRGLKLGLVWLGMAMASCSGADSLTATPNREGSSKTTDQGETVTGVHVAHVNFTPTHTIDFWEVQPGNVLMLQQFDTAQGDAALKLEPMLLDAGGTLGALYRKLMNDPNAPLSPEISAADEHRRQLPIRDGSKPRPVAPPPLYPPGTGAPVVVSAPAQPPAQPGALKVQDIAYNYATWDSGFCTPDRDIGTDQSYCPPGFYGTVWGYYPETIYWESEGHNPQPHGSSSDAFMVYQWTDGAWQQIYHLFLGAGKTVDAFITGGPNYYHGGITGSAVGYAERSRFSFPQLQLSSINPNSYGGSDWCNDINGITHDGTKGIFSRTYQGYACLGSGADIYSTPPISCPLTEPNDWWACGFDHFGDIFYDSTQSALFVSMNMEGSTNGAIGILAPDLHTPLGYVVLSPNDQVAWVAENQKNGDFYTSSSAGPITTSPRVIHRNSVIYDPSQYYTVPTPGGEAPRGVCSQFLGQGLGNGAISSQLSDIVLVNDPSNYDPSRSWDIQGGKVSSHGKLWVHTHFDDQYHVILGIDPYTGIVQTATFYGIPGTTSDVGSFVVGTPYSIEAEGLDVTSDGQVHAQMLANEARITDRVSLFNYTADDPKRL